MNIVQVSEEVYYVDQPFVVVGRTEIEFLKDKVNETPRKRIRLCAHTDTQDVLHEMLIVLAKDTYVRPAKHLRKTESLHVIEGLAQAIFFSSEGEIDDAIALGEQASGRAFYYRIPEEVYHALVLESGVFVFHEVTKGPLDRAETIFPHWAPEEGDDEAVGDYRRNLMESLREFST